MIFFLAGNGLINYPEFLQLLQEVSRKNLSHSPAPGRHQPKANPPRREKKDIPVGPFYPSGKEEVKEEVKDEEERTEGEWLCWNSLYFTHSLVERSGMVDGASDPQSREPGFKSWCCQVKPWASSFIPHCFYLHSYVNENLGIYSGEY